MANHFDPSDLGPEIVDMANGETGELLPDQKTPESAWKPDTNGDPVGSEARATQDPVHLPDFYYRKYSIDGEGKPIAQLSRVDGIMEVFKAKKNTPMVFNQEDDVLRKKKKIIIFNKSNRLRTVLCHCLRLTHNQQVSTSYS